MNNASVSTERSTPPPSQDLPGAPPLRAEPSKAVADLVSAQRRATIRRRGFTGIAILVAVVLLSTAAWKLLHRGGVSTDNAKVEADVTVLSARVGGAVRRINTKDNAVVRAGDVLVEIDDADYAIREAQAAAELDAARAQAAAADAQGLERGGHRPGAMAAVERAQAELDKARADLARAVELRKAEAVTAEREEVVRLAVDVAESALRKARADLAAATANADLSHARVRAAEAALEQARLQRSFTRITAPADGTVSRLSARVGQLVSPGQPVAQLVPDDVYVVANFKETLLSGIKPGQPAVIRLDAYPGLALTGKVESISGATGARFSLLPPDNSTGNFVKVVQWVPIRIAVDADSRSRRVRLRAGLSAHVRVDTEP